MNAQGWHRGRRDILWRTGCALLVLAACAAPLAAQPPAAADNSIDLTGAWKFKGDWEENGQVQGWHQPDFDDSEWQTLQVPGAWEDQGIMTANPRWPATAPSHGYNGYAWYRRHLTLPADWKDAEITLRIGGINDFDWTYFNGRLIGTSTGGPHKQRLYPTPPDALDPEGDNVIAVRVCDTGNVGGIVKPPVELVRTPPAPPEPAPEECVRTRGDMVNLGGSVEVPTSTLVRGDVVAMGGSADIHGHVTGQVVALGGNVRARPGSKIDGDVVAMGGSVVREGDAEIRGSVVAVPIMPASVTKWLGRKTLDRTGPRQPDRWPFLCHGHLREGVSLFPRLALIWGLVALLAVLLFPKRLEAMALALPVHPGRAALYGAGGFVLTPAAVTMLVFAGIIVSLILTITVLGILLIPVVGAAVVAAFLGLVLLLVLGTSSVWLSVGKAVATRLGRPEMHAVWAALIGVVLVALLTALPLVGPFVLVTLLIFGFGAALMTGLGADPEWAQRKFSRRSAPEPTQPDAAAGQTPADQPPGDDESPNG